MSLPIAHTNVFCPIKFYQDLSELFVIVHIYIYHNKIFTFLAVYGNNFSTNFHDEYVMYIINDP